MIKNLLNRFKMKVAIILSICIVISLYNCSKPSLKISEIKVTDFGAVPNDGKSDTEAILSAIEACKGEEEVKLIFEFGTYDIYGIQKDKNGNFKPSLNIDSIDNLTIEGNGSEFIGHDYSTMFHLSECKNLTIKNLSIDWNPLPFTQGKVVEVKDGYVDLEVIKPFRALVGKEVEGMLGYDPELKRMARRYTDHYQKGFKKLTEVPRQGVMRLFVGREDRFANKLPSVGNYIIVRHQIYGNQAIEFSQCTNIQIESITIYSNPGAGIICNSCRDVSIKHLNIMIRPGSGRWMSSTADATYFSSCRGNVVMENCLFEGMGDDATCVKSDPYMVVAERLDNKRFKMSSGTPDRIPRSGDKLELSGKDLVPYTTVTVQSLERAEEENSLIVKLSNELPERTVKGDIIGNASSCPSVRIRNCTVIRSRARGYAIRTRDVIIEDCVFQDVSAAAIIMEADITTWWEAIGSHDVIIRNNRFIDCRFESAVVCGVIETLTNPGSQPSPAGVHQKITIESNIIQGTAGNAFKISSADGVVIANNIIDKPEAEAILLINSRNVSITGNKLTNSKVGFKIGEGCDSSTIKAENNIGF